MSILALDKGGRATCGLAGSWTGGGDEAERLASSFCVGLGLRGGDSPGNISSIHAILVV